MDRSETTIALAIPHTPWVPERAASMARVRSALELDASGGGDTDRDGPGAYREFTERQTNREWSLAMWRWLHESGAEWCFSLQDDVLVPSTVVDSPSGARAPLFWPALRAMLSVLPEGADVLGLSGVHPIAREVERRGHRWYRTSSWLVGWAYAIRRPALGEFLAWRESHPRIVERMTEDSLLNHWIATTGRSTWHPVPTIVDHDTTIGSSYDNDAHSHRRPQSTWRDFGAGSLVDPSWWLPSGEPQLLPTPAARHCWFCLERPACRESGRSSVAICANCVADLADGLIRAAVPPPAAPVKP